MEDNLFDILDDLNIEETSLLLNKDFNISIDKKVKKRIMNSVKKKSKLDFSNKKSVLDKFIDILKHLFFNKKLVTFCTTFIFFLGSGGYIYTQIPVAYISIDINPSIELTLNKFNKVISYEAYNPSGETLLASNSKNNITVDNAISNIIASAVSKQYLSSNKSSALTLSTVSNDSILRKGLEVHVKDTLESSLKNNSINASIRSSNNTLDERDNAKSLGFTVGKLLLVEELKSLDSSIMIEDFKDTSILEIENTILDITNSTSDDNDITNILGSESISNNINTNIIPSKIDNIITPSTSPNSSNITNSSTTKPSSTNNDKTTNNNNATNTEIIKPNNNSDKNNSYDKPDKDKNNGHNKPDKDKYNDKNNGNNKPDKDKYNDKNNGHNKPDKDKYNDKNNGHNKPDKDKYNDKNDGNNKPDKDKYNDKNDGHNKPDKDKYNNKNHGYNKHD